jgi:molybdopterin synthase catalytic subunit
MPAMNCIFIFIIIKEGFMLDQWIADVKKNADSGELGMILIHNGIVRSTSKDGKPVKGMHLTYKKEKLKSLITEFSKREGIVTVRAWINEGNLKVGDDIMYVLVAGKLRKFVLPVLEELVSHIKQEVVYEEEFS